MLTIPFRDTTTNINTYNYVRLSMVRLHTYKYTYTYTHKYVCVCCVWGYVLWIVFVLKSQSGIQSGSQTCWSMFLKITTE